MAVYEFEYSLALGTSKTGLFLQAQLLDTLGANIGLPINTGFTELGAGNYLWNYTQFTVGFRGGIKFVDSLNPNVCLAAISVNPEEVASPLPLDNELKVVVSNEKDTFEVIGGVGQETIEIIPGVQ